jgi:tetratricopeptide (TPR) repeat protein
MIGKIVPLLGAALLGLGVLALSACSDNPTGDWQETCSHGTSQDALGACTLLIKSKNLTGDDLAEVYVNRGNAYRNMGQYAEAIQDYDQALKLNPEDAETLYNRGAAKKASGDAAGGESDMQAARKLKPEIGQ